MRRDQHQDEDGNNNGLTTGIAAGNANSVGNRLVWVTPAPWGNASVQGGGSSPREVGSETGRLGSELPRAQVLDSSVTVLGLRLKEDCGHRYR